VLGTAYRSLRSRHPKVRWVVVGDGPYQPDLARMHPDVLFTGYLTGKQLATAYASADIFAFPSTTDTFGNVILEAQASGLPSVVSDVGGPKELVKDGAYGFITPALDIPAFTSALEALVVDGGLRKSMGLAARVAVESRTWDGAFQSFWAMSEL
jgi:glycosyltransferase involved in cell wall biosynthesis